MLISEIMDGGGEDRISNLPDGVVGDILSRLPTKDAVRTSTLSKDWEYKWTSIYNIQLDNRGISLCGETGNKTFVSFVERVLHLTRNSRIKSFRLSCSTKLNSQFLETCIAGVLIRNIQHLEINTCQCGGNTSVSDLFNCSSLTELKLVSCCDLSISHMKNCFLNLKSLHLGHGVQLWSKEISNTSEVILLDFPALEDLELRDCIWRGVKSVEINAPALIRFVAEGKVGRFPNDCLIKIDVPKLEKFESHGFLDNYVVAAPSISNAVLTSFGGGTTLGLRAHAILQGFPVLNTLKLSDGIAKALVESNVDLSLPCFNELKQLELINYLYSRELLRKLLQVMPSLESLYLNVGMVGFGFCPPCFPSRLKVVELVGFRATKSQIHFAESVLKNADNLETLFVFVCHKPLMPRIEIKKLLSTFPKRSTLAMVVVNESRKRRRLN